MRVKTLTTLGRRLPHEGLCGFFFSTFSLSVSLPLTSPPSLRNDVSFPFGKHDLSISLPEADDVTTKVMILFRSLSLLRHDHF